MPGAAARNALPPPPAGSPSQSDAAGRLSWPLLGFWPAAGLATRPLRHGPPPLPLLAGEQPVGSSLSGARPPADAHTWDTCGTGESAPAWDHPFRGCSCVDLELSCAGSSPSLIFAFAVCKMGFLPHTATRLWHQAGVSVRELQRAVSPRWSMFSVTCLGAGGVTFGDRCSLVATSPPRVSVRSLCLIFTRSPLATKNYRPDLVMWVTGPAGVGEPRRGCCPRTLPVSSCPAEGAGTGAGGSPWQPGLAPSRAGAVEGV